MESNGTDPFFTAAGDVFSQMFGVDATASPPRVLEGAEAHAWEISAILGIAGAAQGVVALRFPLHVVDALLKASGVETSGEQDRLATSSGLVAELVNIISGNAIGSFEGMDLDISPPVVVKGKNHQITWPKIAPVVATEYSSSLGAFEVAVCFNGKR